MVLMSSLKTLASLLYGRHERASCEPLHLDAFYHGLSHVFLSSVFDGRHPQTFGTYLKNGAFNEIMAFLEQSKRKSVL